MSKTMEDLLANQSLTITAINQLLTNFKKAGHERRTPDFIKRRLENLEAYWQEFQTNHVKLSGFSDKSSEYFVNNHYQSAKEFYLSAREMIKQTLPVLVPGPATPVAGPSSPFPVSNPTDMKPEDIEMSTTLEKPQFTSQGTNSKLDEQLKKQSSNFKAFSRAIANINIDDISEKWEFEDTLKTLETRWSVIDTLHWELDGDLDGKNANYEEMFTAYEATYNRIKRALNSKLWSVSHREKTTPKMDVPVFNGKYNQWVSFKDLFTEAIHNNPSLSQAQKMQFLKAKVKGEAEGLIQHLQISSDNYSVCWELLNHRYNNKKLIFTSHINILMNLPIMQQPSIHNIKRIHDTTRECLNAIKNLKVDVSTWDPLLVYLLTNKLDTETHSDYVESLKQPRELPKLSDFLDFLEAKFTSMEASKRRQEAPKPLSSNSKPSNYFPKPTKQSYSSNKGISQAVIRDFRFNKTCPLCKNGHGLYQCEQFIEMSSNNKKQTISKLKLCENCLYSHNGKACISTKRCRECDGFHNTILHEAFTHSQTKSSNVAVTKPADMHTSSEQAQSTNSHVAQQRDIPEILLSTALVKVEKSDGSYLTMRALIDQGSQTSLITENAAQQLCLPRQICKGVITGIGVKDNTCKGNLNIKCSSLNESYSFHTDVFIMKTLTKHLPSYTFAKPTWPYLEHIELADPEFYISRPIDILFGADIYSHIILDGICKLDQTIPIAQQTQLGWILCGNVPISLQCNVVQIDVDQLHKFWEIEDISESGSLSSDDLECIQYYNATTTRGVKGRYKVRIPLKPNYQDNLGNSKSKAIAQFAQLERKFIKHNNIAHEYRTFMNEYLALGHMKPASCNSKLQCFLPHHCVLRESSLTTSLRVVFNASSKTSSGQSLNDLMRKGPNLQQDLQSLILKWRQYKFAFTADIEKMFRQILVHEEDQSLQKIVWRNSSNERLQEFQLTTVTYGTKAAPFLAMMTLRKLANDERHNYPEAARVVEESLYMDDVLKSSPDVDSARKLQQDLIELLSKGGFNLRKWASNSPQLLNDQMLSSFNFKQPESTKTLGLRWNPVKDNFTFDQTIDSFVRKATKRSVLSDVSKVFDPLGWLTPFTTKLKILFQYIWESKIEWDEQISEHLYSEWVKIKAESSHINAVEVPRWLGIAPGRHVELHGFCDSSVKAYGCIIYCKTINQGQPNITLVAGKSKIVPCGKNISLPRLELCGAQLLAKLMSKIVKCFVDHQIDIYGWTDSTAVLGWLHGDPGRWQTFVANRTRQITSAMPSVCWRYVKSGDNPADCASRGLSIQHLNLHPLWWQGPSWLKTFKHEDKQPIYTTDLEVKKTSHINVIIKQDGESILQQLIAKYSSYMKLVRILAWILRFIFYMQDKHIHKLSYLSLKEYLSQMNARSKWRHPQSNLKINDVVLINDVNLPPGKWALGRIMELHPGQDGYIRVVTVKTKNGVLKRPVVKLSVLPVHDETDQTNKSNSNNCTRKRYNFTAMATTFLLFMSLICTSHCAYHNTNIPLNQSLYFDKINDMHLIRDEWKLVVYFDMNPYWDGMKTLSKNIQYLDGVCKQTNVRTHCDGVLIQLNHGYQEMRHYNNMLLSQHFDARARNKRGLINGVGYLANTLFGVLDERFAASYESDIKAIKSNQNHMAMLWKNQTSVVEAEFNILKRTEQFINKQYKNINQKLLGFQNDISQFKLAIQNMSISTDFTITSLIAYNLLYQLSSIQNKLLDAVTDIYHGNFNLHLISPDQLKHELNIISGQLPKDLSSPVDGTEFSAIYHLLKVRGRMSEHYFIFEIKIPLIARDAYEILKIIPVPHRVNSNLAEVVPVSEFVAVNLNKDTLLLLTKNDLTLCVPQSASKVLCHVRTPEYSIKDDHSLCRTSEQTRKCSVNVSPCTNRLTDLNKENRYFYFCCEQCHIRLLCPDQVTAIHLSQAGLLSVGQGCAIKSQNFTLYGHRQMSSKLEVKADLESFDIAPINNIINISLPLISLSNTDLETNQRELSNIRTQLDAIKQSSPSAELVRTHDVHHYTAIYVIIGIMAAVGIYFAWQRVLKLRQPRVPKESAAAALAPEPGALRRAASAAILAAPAPCHSVKCCEVFKCSRVPFSESDSGEVATTSASRKDVGTSPILKSVFTISEN